MTTGDGETGGRGLSPEDLHGVDPVAAVMLADACRAIAAYPELVVVGALFTAAERVPGGWQVVCPGDPLPQGAREMLADHLEDSGEEPLAAAGRRLRLHPADEVAADGRRFRVVRIEQLVRTGPDGPEPPRPTDFDPRPGDHRLPRCRPFDLLHDGQTIPDLATAELLCQLLDATARTGTEPSEAFLTPAQLTPAFTVAERSEGRWRPVGRLHETPQQARESLATYFRHVVPAIERPGEADLAEYTEAASLMADPARRNGIAVAGRRFRIVRLERLTLMGPDGPEPPRPTDADPR
ncbi:DUF5954 family protein [Actinomadura rugatobispora]|uniref:DUF5954 family protein n=1 Tax=Actinomadura rugatobispora TaxID=1994 RepID=A0ABW1AHK8_9ACTN|nr:hypothetical protein GCM10010200_073310 [Actinomadura rugatobispora]